VIITIVYPIVVGLSSPLRHNTESRELHWLSPLTWWEWDWQGRSEQRVYELSCLEACPLHLTDCFVVRHYPCLARCSATLNRNGTDGPKKIDIEPFHFPLEDYVPVPVGARDQVVGTLRGERDEIPAISAPR